MKQKDDKLNKVKGFALTLLFAMIVLIIAVNIIKASNENIAGRAFYKPIRVYGTIEPALPDGTKISFRLNGLEIVSTTLKNDEYGYEERLYFKMDDESTLEREGYREGDIIKIYIEDIEIGEVSYFESGANKKDIKIPTSKRFEVTTKAAQNYIERTCETFWQCGEWSECIDSIQKRTCVDIFDCGTEEGKPEEEKGCEVKAAVVEEPIRIMEFITIEWILTISLFIILTVSLIFLIRKAMWDHRIRKYTKRQSAAAKKKR